MYDKSKAREEVKKRMPWYFESDKKENDRLQRNKNRVAKQIEEIRKSQVRSERKEERVTTPMEAHRLDISPVTRKMINRKYKRDVRADQIVKMRFEDRMTYQEIGDRFGVSRERIRQILIDCGSYAKLPKPPEFDDMVCSYSKCGKVFQVKRNTKRKYCSPECRSKDTLIGKPQKEFTKEDWSKYNKIRNYRQSAIQARKNYFENNKEKIYEKNKEYVKEYKRRPEVIEKRQKYIKNKYDNDPEFRNKINKRHNEYVKNRIKNDPEYAERRRRQAREYYRKKRKDPEFLRSRREYYKNVIKPKNDAKRNERSSGSTDNSFEDRAKE